MCNTNTINGAVVPNSLSIVLDDSRVQSQSHLDSCGVETCGQICKNGLMIQKFHWLGNVDVR